MKAVMISIQPKCVEKIARGEKTIEVRKTAPKEVPFKCYIYESRNGGHRCKHCNEKDSCYSYAPKNVGCYNGSGKVIGWFICDKVMFLTPLGLRGFEMREEILKLICLTNDDLNAYGGLKTLYGWHISDLKIYDKPKELGDFKKHCHYKDRNSYCLANECEYYSDWTGICCNWVERPPQSWCYVKDLGEEK